MPRPPTSLEFLEEVRREADHKYDVAYSCVSPQLYKLFPLLPTYKDQHMRQKLREEGMSTGLDLSAPSYLIQLGRRLGPGRLLQVGSSNAFCVKTLIFTQH